MAAIDEQPEQPLCIHYVNTVSKQDGSRKNDVFADFETFLNWAVLAGLLPKRELSHWRKWGRSRPGEAARFLSTAVGFRDYLYDLFTKSAATQRISTSKLNGLNAMIAAPSIQRTLHIDEDRVRERWNCGDGLMGLLRRVALSAADVMLDESWQTVIQCSRDECDWIAIDTSRNHSRRFCSSAGCGNLARVTRHYHRHKAQSARARRLAAVS